MTLSSNQRIVVWLILALCIISVPLSFINHHRSSETQTGEDESSQLQSAIPFRDRIQVIHLNGMIIDKGESSLLSSMGTSTSVRKKLYKALKNEHVKAVLLRINSPGGTVASSQELHGAVMALRKAGKPVIVSMGDLAASGGYYVACAADRVFAEPGTLTGSIGVIMNLFNLQGIEQKLGVQAEVVKSGQFKDIGSPNRAMTPEEKNLLQSLILDSYDQFVAAVAAGRKMDEQSVRKLADGRIYSGRQALKVGLIDELGGFEESKEAIRKLARERYNLKADLPVDEGEGLGFLNSLLESAAERIPESKPFEGLMPALRSDLQKVPLYLMQ